MSGNPFADAVKAKAMSFVKGGKKKGKAPAFGKKKGKAKPKGKAPDEGKGLPAFFKK